MNHAFDFTAIIPTYNRRHVVGRAIDSVLAQTYPCRAIIVIDDGSTDGTDEYLRRRYADVVTFRCLRQQNTGMGQARNNGVEAAATEWVAFLDSDDEWYQFRLQRIVEALEMHPDLDAVGVGMDIDSNSPLLQAPQGKPVVKLLSLERLLLQNGAVCWIVIRKRVFDAVGGFRFNFCEDHDLALRLVSRGYRLGFMPEPMGNIHTEESGQALDHAEWCERLLQFWRAKLDKYGMRGIKNREALSSLYYDMSLGMMEKAQIGLSMRYLVSSLLQMPFPIKLIRYGRWQRHKRFAWMLLRGIHHFTES